MLDRDLDRRPHGGDRVAEPFVRPRGAPPPVDREVPRLAVDADERLPLPPPVTAALEDPAPGDGVPMRADAERVTRRNAARVDDAPTGSPGRARLDHTGFLDAHGIDGEGWLRTHGANSSGFLETQGADAPGWLASLDARRRAALRRGWNVDTLRDPR